MSTENEDLNPHAMDDAAKQAMLTALDDESADGDTGPDEGNAGDAAEAASPTGEAAVDAGASAATGTEATTAGGTPEPTAEAVGGGEEEAGDAAAAGAATSEKLSLEELQRQINGLKNALIEERQKNKQLKGLDLPQAPKDFAAEKKVLREKWDAGELDTDQYNEQREALTLEQARFETALTYAQLKQRDAQEQAQQSWAERAAAWEQENADFLANPLRRKAVNDLMEEFDRDPNNRMSDEELLQKVQETAFEAFNWAPKVANVQPVVAESAQQVQQARQVVAARAASAAAAIPPPMTTGAGSASEAGKIKLDALVENPAKLAGARSVIAALLGDEA